MIERRPLGTGPRTPHELTAATGPRGRLAAGLAPAERQDPVAAEQPQTGRRRPLGPGPALSDR
ncbi:hypothetical protein PV721_32450 [Streptomyces sp. MB09-01]|uniref:hypothetical protein n=1 Tax=Streptomyces TaxID=1883 RepID=UPI0029BBF633|nr:hypothetical protein [Streptomyces sp. MB09-01]MDX3538966.1 hypothetical protein [Streptomyces sp. MB09-01]